MRRVSETHRSPGRCSHRLTKGARWRAAIAALALTGCASQGLPPGGPEDPDPPEIVSITPDTMATNVAPRAVVFRFNEVVSERPQGAPSMSALFLISPGDGAPVVDWNRTALTVRPRGGWRRNTTYSVTMLPGLADLRGNARTEGAHAVFSTGSSIPRTAITGYIFDWLTGRPAGRAIVEAISRPDSVAYLAVADSSGWFRIPYAPAGDYTIRGFVDANNNRGFDERELWDSIRVTLADSASVELLAFSHDTIGPRISAVAVLDSVTLRATFDRGIHPDQSITSAIFTLRAADSTVVPIAAARSARAWEEARRARTDSLAADSARRVLPARPDSLRRRPLAGPDSARRVSAPPAVPAVSDSVSPMIPRRPSKPSPVLEVIVEVARPLQPRAAYRLEAKEVRGLLLTPRTSERAFTTPAPPSIPADSAAGTAPPNPGRSPGP